MAGTLYQTAEGCAIEVKAQVFRKHISKIRKLSAFRVICV